MIEHLTIPSKLFISPKTEQKVSGQMLITGRFNTRYTSYCKKGSGGDADCRIEFPGKALIAVKTSIRVILRYAQEIFFKFDNLSWIERNSEFDIENSGLRR